MKTRLDSFERQIEKTSGSYRPLSKKERRKMEALLDRIRKTRTINIRIAESVLEELKRRSQEEGLPYQTLISSILHKYVTNRLVDEASIRKSLRILQHQ
jgi:predicted DNA binding CopG/RHH family protein